MTTKMKILIGILIVAVLGISLLPIITQADGGVFPPPYYWIQESEQKAVIFYENGKETLILSITFRGDAKDFGWVIPVPQKPEVTKGSDEIFTSLEEIVQKYQRYGYEPMPLMAPMMGLEKMAEPVTVIETKKIDYYEIAVLSATDSQALAKWLSEHGYQYPEKSAYILNDYINNQWYFVAVKISPEAEKAEEVVKGLKEGHATPLKLEFNSEAIIYPLRISAIETNRSLVESKISVEPEMEGRLIYPYSLNYIPISLYVIADGKKEIPGFSVYYANWIKAKEIRKLAYDVNGKPLINAQGKRYYLTYLSRNMATKDMTYDLVVRPAENNQRVNAPNPWLNLLWGTLIVLGIIFVWLLSPLGIMFVVATLIRGLVRQEIVKIFSKIFQIFSFIITLGFFIPFLVLVFKSEPSATAYLWTVSATISFGLLAIGQILTCIIQSKLTK